MHVCMQCLCLTTCFYCLGFTAHRKATNTTSHESEDACRYLSKDYPASFQLLLQSLVLENYHTLPTCLMPLSASAKPRLPDSICSDNALILFNLLNELEPQPKSFKYISDLVPFASLLFFLHTFSLIRTECKHRGLTIANPRSRHWPVVRLERFTEVRKYVKYSNSPTCTSYEKTQIK